MWQPLRGIPFVAAVVVVLVVTVQATGATPSGSSVFTVESRSIPGVDTGIVLKKNHAVTVTATGTVCPYAGSCIGPDGDPSANASSMLFGGFLQPQAPAYGLVARVGSGKWTHVG